MADMEQIEILKKGANFWNDWRKEHSELIIDLSSADLIGAEFNSINLHRADLSRVDLVDADLINSDLSEATLDGSNLSRANLTSSNLKRANLLGANLTGANLKRANLGEVNLTNADLTGAVLTEAELNMANLSDANLSRTIISRANIKKTILKRAIIGNTIFSYLDLSDTIELQTMLHRGRSTIGTDTLSRSKGKISSSFLRQCGLSPWEIEVAKLYNPDLNPHEIAEILDVEIFSKRTRGPIYIGGIFISYSHENSNFIDRIEEKLKKEGAAVWRDIHGLKAGRLTKQITDQIRIRDILLIVLSKESINSDWVENELEQARKREILENRDIICPIAIDDSWKEKITGDPLWRQVSKYNILSFSKWEDDFFFNGQFKKLVSGIKTNYTIFYNGVN